LHEGQYTFLSYFDQQFLERETFQSCIVNRNIFLFNKFFEHRGIYEIMWKNNVHPDSLQMTTYDAWAFYAG